MRSWVLAISLLMLFAPLVAEAAGSWGMRMPCKRNFRRDTKPTKHNVATRAAWIKRQALTRLARTLRYQNRAALGANLPFRAAKLVEVTIQPAGRETPKYMRRLKRGTKGGRPFQKVIAKVEIKDHAGNAHTMLVKGFGSTKGRFGLDNRTLEFFHVERSSP